MPACFAAVDDLGDPVGAADVAGVDAHGGDAGVDRLEREARVEVDVGDHRDRAEAHDLPQRLGVLVLRDGAADDLAAAPASAAICAVVASTSRVGVSVIDWTTTGAPPPIATWPTWIPPLAGHRSKA